MKIAVLRERQAGETRVAATPETVAKLAGLGASVSIEKGAGEGSRIPDDQFKQAGATVAASAATAVKGADIVLAVRRPTAAALKGAAKNALVIASMDPYGNEKDIKALADAGVTAVAMEFMPRITRAQSMDVLSSQANLAGYQAVIEAAAAFDRAMPMMMTAAGTVRPAKAFVMGAGVAGLQAIATARRLGAMVSATDVRAAAGEQVESLGGKFIMTEALKDASGEGGYARELTEDEQKAQAELVAGHIAKQDIVITTALIPGRPAPRLVDKAMVESMAPGSVVVDLATERGGNVELSKPDQVVTHKDVTIIGHTNLAGHIPATASHLYARNLVAFLETQIDTGNKKLAIDWEDELVTATVLTRDGKVVHPNIAETANTAKSSGSRASTAKKASTSRSGTAAKSGTAGKSSTAKASTAKSASSKAATSKAATGKASGGSKTAAAKSGSKASAGKTSSSKTSSSTSSARKSSATKTGAKSKSGE